MNVMLSYSLIFISAEFDESDIVKIQRKDGTVSEFIKVQDTLLALDVLKSGFIPDYRVLIPSIRNMRCREDDIFLCGFLKTGNTFHWFVNKCGPITSRFKKKNQLHVYVQFTLALVFINILCIPNLITIHCFSLKSKSVYFYFGGGWHRYLWTSYRSWVW